MSTKTVLVAHRLPAVRDRFAVALADARHAFVAAGDDVAARAAVRDAAQPIHLALLDLTLADDPVEFVRALRRDAGAPLPVMAFSGSVRSARDVPALSALHVGYVNEHASTPQILPALAPRLVPDSFNRRVSGRIAIGVPISYRSGQTIAGAVTLDVGKGGVAIRTMSPLDKGESVQVRFRLPGISEEVTASGHVAWSDRNLGMGVQFDALSAATRDLIDGFVEEASERGD